MNTSHKIRWFFALRVIANSRTTTASPCYGNLNWPRLSRKTTDHSGSKGRREMYAANDGAVWECIICELHCPKACVSASVAARQLETIGKERKGEKKNTIVYRIRK